MASASCGREKECSTIKMGIIMLKYFICIFFAVAQASICYGQDVARVFDKYKNLTDRNYVDISKEIKKDIDTLLVNGIDNLKEKNSCLKGFHKRVKRINAIIIPNKGITDSVDSDFSNLAGYENYHCPDTYFDRDGWVDLVGPLYHMMTCNKAQYFVNENMTSFLMLIEQSDRTCFVHLEGLFDKQDIRRISHGIELLRENAKYLQPLGL